MIKNYLSIALRIILKYRFTSLVNIIGLSIGISCFIFIYIFVNHELSYNNFHDNHEKIYRLYSIGKTSTGEKEYATNPHAIGGILKENYSESFPVVRLFHNEYWVKQSDRHFKEDIFFADEDLFNVFTFPFSKGNPATALTNKNSVVLSDEFARKFFGDDNPIGQTLTLNNEFDFLVTGVINEIPSNSSLKFDIIVPYSNIEDFTYKNIHQSWNDWGCHIYLKFFENYGANELESQFSTLINTNAPEYLTEGKIKFGLQKLDDIHLNSFALEIEEGISRDYLNLLILIAFLILFVASINFMNLYIAKHSERSKEIGVRKIFGAERSQLIYQYILEAIVHCYVALTISIVLILIFKNEFNALIGKNIDLNIFSLTNVIIFIFFGFILGVITGLYPSVFFSSKKTVDILKGVKELNRRSFFRYGLIVIQFAVSIALLISQFIISNQVNFMKSSELGFDSKGVVNIILDTQKIEDARKKMSAFEITVTQDPNVNKITIHENVPGKNFQNYWKTVPKGWQNPDAPRMYVSHVDENYVDTYDIELLSGRNFSKEFSTDPYYSAIINERAVLEMGLDVDNALNHTFNFDHYNKPLTIIGVAKEFHFKSLQNAIEPLILLYDPSYYRASYISVDFNIEDLSKGIQLLDNYWSELIPGVPFEYEILEDTFNQNYSSVENTDRLTSTFAIISIFIASLGLFSISSLIASSKTKEIGIRKAIGSTTISIIYLILKELLILLVIANVVAWPIAYWAMSSWLQDFPFKVPLDVTVFIVSTIITLIVALATVSYSVTKAALTNPIDLLRYE